MDSLVDFSPVDTSMLYSLYFNSDALTPVDYVRYKSVIAHDFADWYFVI